MQVKVGIDIIEVERIKQSGLKHFLTLKNKKSIGNALFFCQIFQKNVA